MSNLQNQFPILYKKTSTGAIQFWSIKVLEPGTIYTEFGQKGTDRPQIAIDVISVGKNLGKKNETTPYEQACLDAKSKWEGKVKKGYVEKLEGAEKGENELPSIDPMLAHTYDKQGHKIKLPCLVQPKLDGIRCIAIKKDGEVKLYSRTRKPIFSVPHIIAELEDFMPDSCILDGELYNHEFKNNFEHIVHLVRQETPCEGHEDVEYHIYDIPSSELDNVNRMIQVSRLFNNHDAKDSFLMEVPTWECEDEQQAFCFYTHFMKLGYEGIMLRNYSGLYVNKRSYDLIKLKEFQDAEYPIVAVEQGSGKLKGHAGSFVCETSEGKRFNVKLKGELSALKRYWTDLDSWYGKKMTVQYQALTRDGIPRFPVGLVMRDYE